MYIMNYLINYKIKENEEIFFQWLHTQNTRASYIPGKTNPKQHANTTLFPTENKSRLPGKYIWLKP